VVRVPIRIAALDRKLLRDLWEMKGQALAIAAVIGAGVVMFVAFSSNFGSLRLSQGIFYENSRFADVFATLKRAPARLEERFREIPGVEAVATRVVADVTIDVPGMAEPATGRLISLPERGRPLLNDLFLRRGRWIDPSRPDEVLANESFSEAHGFGPGDRFAAVINGRRRWLTIVGIALSPEYVYAIRPGELFPDQRRFGIFWMDRRALATAFDMEGGFNDVSIRLARGVPPENVIDDLDRLIEPYGGLGSVPQALQLSAWTLENELRQLQNMGLFVPAIFLGVAAFILNVALTRALAIQRPQIAALKALGYSNRELAWHYVKFALVIAAAGALGGIGLGMWLGAAMMGMYSEFFRFPVFQYRLSIDVAIGALGGSLVVGALGAQSAVRHAVRVPPAEAMRPEPPARYRPSVFERSWRGMRLTMATRMILRNLERQPVRSAMSVVGIAFAVAVLFVGLAFIDVMDDLINRQFVLSMRQDATVNFVEPRSSTAVFAVEHLPGVLDVEATRSAPVRLRAGSATRTLAITGVPPSPRLNRIVDRRGEAVPVPEEGLVMSQLLGDILGVGAGDRLQVEVLEGRRPVRTVTVAALVDDSMGLQAYMNIDALRRMLREGGVLSGAAMTVDPAAIGRFYAEVKAIPAIAGVALREITLRNFRETMGEQMNLMIFFFVLFAGVIAFGVVYNSARVSLSERSRELASLRVLGFTRAEISLILLGELALLTLLALPVGALIGYALGELVLSGINNELYRMSFTARPATAAASFLTVIAASLISGLIVRRRLDRLDLIGVLKTRE
jgi:putative ABC transport system permease protein